MQTNPSGAPVHRPAHVRALAAALMLACCSVASYASAAPKDIVLSRIAAAGPSVTQGDALAVSVLVERSDGTLISRSSEALFRTGERLRVKVVPSRSGKIAVYNTNPHGQTSLVWSGEVQFGRETVSPRMVLTGTSGEDQLHVVLEPHDTAAPGVWMNTVLKARKAGSRKDIALDSQSTPHTTYIVNTGGQGVISTLRVLHAR